MATLRHPRTQATFHLKPQTLIGRSRSCDLHLEGRAASGQHALIRWTSQGWELRDLGSRNGTHFNGRRINVGERIALSRGARIGFGQAKEPWVLDSDSQPGPTAISGEEEVCAEGGMLALPPGVEAPSATLYRGRGGQWVVEMDGALRPLGEEPCLRVGDREWALHLPEPVESTEHLEAPGLIGATLRFEVSADEETTHLTLATRGKDLRLEDRAHHYLLLTLGRQRLKDRADGEGPGEEGWVDREHLAKLLRIEPPLVSVQIHRARRQLAQVGVVDAAQIIESRPYASQIRIGVEEVEVVRL